ncbi:MAG: 8-oxo-dGTP diphosphatase MutT [Pseudomonadota bacterium]
MNRVTEKNKKPHFVVTAGLIWKNGKLLIAKRPQGTHLEGFWEFPGGKQKEGEGLKECLEREIDEELGIKARVEESFLTVDHEYPNKRISLHVFNCTWLKGKPLPLQCQEVRWVVFDDLSKLPFPPPDIKVIETLAGRGKKEKRRI